MKTQTTDAATSAQKHTEGEWKIDTLRDPDRMTIRATTPKGFYPIVKTFADRNGIGTDEADANAERIVHCVNNFDRVIDALEDCYMQLGIWGENSAWDEHDEAASNKAWAILQELKNKNLVTT